MKILISGYKNNEYKKAIFKFLKQNDLNVEMIEFNEELNPSQIGQQMAQVILGDENALGIIVDNYGVGPYNGANKIPNSVCAPVCDEHSAHMTREHNGTKIIVIPTSIVALELGQSIALKFATEDYAGGRHQIRLDMMKQIDNGGN